MKRSKRFYTTLSGTFTSLVGQELTLYDEDGNAITFDATNHVVEVRQFLVTVRTVNMTGAIWTGVSDITDAGNRFVCRVATNTFPAGDTLVIPFRGTAGKKLFAGTDAAGFMAVNAWGVLYDIRD